MRSAAAPDAVKSAAVVTKALPFALTITARSVAVVTTTSFAVTVTMPVKSLVALLNVTLPEVEVTVVVPSTLRDPVWVTLPTDVVVRSPVKVVVPNVVVPPEVVVRSTALPDTVKSSGVVNVALPAALTTTVSLVLL